MIHNRRTFLSCGAAVGLVTVTGAVLPLLLAHHFGALGIARGDDWSYLRTLLHWSETGTVNFNHWVSMTLVGQLALARPMVWVFGRDIAAVQAFTALLGLGGLMAVVWLGYMLTRSIWIATFVALLVAASPLWGPLSVSFMTDVPAFSMSMVACALGVHALRARAVSLPILVAGVLVGFVGFTIRQYGAVPVIALVLVGGWSLWRERRSSELKVFAGVVAIVVFASVVVLMYWQTIPGGKAVTPGFPTVHSIGVAFYKGAGMLRLLGLVLAPMIVLVGPMRILRRSWTAGQAWSAVAGSGVVVVLGLTALRSAHVAFVGNYVGPDGALSQGLVAGNRPDIMPSGAFTVLEIIGVLAGTLLVLAIVPIVAQAPARSKSDADLGRGRVFLFLGLVAAGYVLAYVLAALLGLQISDRYALPVLPLLALLVGRDRGWRLAASSEAQPRLSSRSVLASTVALGALLCVGVVFTADSAAFDGARWRVDVATTRLGWKPDQIAGGWEWNNYYARSPVVRTQHLRQRCITVRLEPGGDVHRNDVVAYRYYRSPLVAPVAVVALRTRQPCTPGRTSGPDRQR